MRKGAGFAWTGFVLAVLLLSVSPVRAQTTGEISIVHTGPTNPLPGQQIYLTAILRNATRGTVTWNNGSMASDAVAPMTNLSQPQDAGWMYAAWLPAQPDGTQISYTILAARGATNVTESYVLGVSFPPPPGLTAADQEAWMLTVAATLTMIGCALIVIYWYAGRRLQREGM